MKLAANIKEATSSLYSAKQRSLLTLIGIVIGIGSVIAMITVGSIVKLEAVKQFQELGTEILTIRKSYFGGGNNRQSNSDIRLKDVQLLADESSSIVMTAPYTRSSGSSTFRGKNVADGEILGVTESFAELNKLEMENGRFISDLDYRRYFAVIGADVASGILQKTGAQQIVGESIKIAGQVYIIVGVLSRTAAWGPMRYFDVNRSSFIPITTAQRILENPDIRDIVALMRTDVHHSEATREVKEFFRRKAKGAAITIESAKQIIEQMNKQMRLFVLLLGTVGSISLIVGGIGVMNIMLVSVTERRKEIGLRRALGARRKDIQGQFLIESVILSLLGGFFGIAIGVGGVYGICHFTGWTFLFSPTAIALGFGVAFTVGVVFGFWPARQASRLDPIAALRAN